MPDTNIALASNLDSVRFEDQATDPATPPAGYKQVFTRAGGLYLRDENGDVSGPLAAPVEWTQEVDEALTALTAVTTNGATWSLDTYLKIVTTSASWRTARVDVPIELAPSWAAEIEVELAADFSASGDEFRLAVADDGELSANNSFHGFSVKGDGSSLVVFGSGVASLDPVDVSAGWHTARMVYTPFGVRCYWDGVQTGGTNFNARVAGDSFRMFVWAYGTYTARFRNAKAWSGNAPDSVFDLA